MKQTRLHIGTRSGRRDVGSARLFQLRHKNLPEGARRHDVRNGYLFETRNVADVITTTMLDFPMAVAGTYAFVRSETDTAEVRPLQRYKFDREYLFTGEFRESEEPPLVPEAENADVGQEFVFGGPPPQGPFTVNVLFSSGRTRDGSASRLHYASLLADQEFEMVSDAFQDPYPAGDGSHLNFWYRVDFVLNGGRIRRLVFSEDWVSQRTGGYRFVSFGVHRRVIAGQATGARRGGLYFVQMELRLPTLEPNVGAEVTSDLTWDHGHAALYTLAIDTSGEGPPTVVWDHLWALENEADDALRSQSFPPNPPNNGQDLSGVTPNEFMDMVMYPTQDGGVRGVYNVRVVRPAWREGGTSDDDYGLYTETALAYAEWGPEGAFTRTVPWKQILLSMSTYDFMLATEADWGAGTAEVVAKRQEYGIDGNTVEDDYRWAPLKMTFSEADPDVVFVEFLNLMLSEDTGTSPGQQGISHTGGLEETYNYQLSEDNPAKVALLDVSTFDTVQEWESKDTKLSPVGSNSSFPSTAMDPGFVTLARSYDGVSSPGGWGALALLNFSMENVDGFFENERALAFFREGEAVEKSTVPADGAIDSDELEDVAVQVYQAEIPDEGDEEDSDGPRQQLAYCLSIPGGTYISADAGDSWMQIAPRGLQAGSVVFSTLWPAEPWNPLGQVNGGDPFAEEDT